MFNIKQIYTYSPLRNYSYIIYSTKSGESVCIDPFDATVINNFHKENSLSLKYILNTHEHKDHTQGNLELKEISGASVLAHPNAVGFIPGLDDVLHDGQIVISGEEESIIAWDTPGHTFCHLCFALKSNEKPRALFSGDTLFNAGVGNCYRGGDAKTLYKTIRTRLEPMENHVRLYPGHDYWESNLKFAREVDPNNSHILAMERVISENHTSEKPYTSDFGEERKVNPYFRLQNPEFRKSSVFSSLSEEEQNNDESLFLHLRKMRDMW